MNNMDIIVSLELKAEVTDTIREDLKNLFLIYGWDISSSLDKVDFSLPMKMSLFDVPASEYVCCHEEFVDELSRMSSRGYFKYTSISVNKVEVSRKYIFK